MATFPGERSQYREGQIELIGYDCLVYRVFLFQFDQANKTAFSFFGSEEVALEFGIRPAVA